MIDEKQVIAYSEKPAQGEKIYKPVSSLELGFCFLLANSVIVCEIDDGIETKNKVCQSKKTFFIPIIIPINILAALSNTSSNSNTSSRDPACRRI